MKKILIRWCLEEGSGAGGTKSQIHNRERFGATPRFRSAHGSYKGFILNQQL